MEGPGLSWTARKPARLHFHFLSARFHFVFPPFQCHVEDIQQPSHTISRLDDWISRWRFVRAIVLGADLFVQYFRSMRRQNRRESSQKY